MQVKDAHAGGMRKECSAVAIGFKATSCLANELASWRFNGCPTSLELIHGCGLKRVL